ncbi:hypothetical protein SLE2022_220890 [Rubroshorea leprosula]
MARADDVEHDRGRRQEESWMETYNVEATARRKKFEFEDDIDRMMSAVGSDIQANEFTESSIGKSQKCPISKLVETAEEGGYVPDSLSMHLMQNQGQNSNCENGNLIGPIYPNRSKEEKWVKSCGLDTQACLREDVDWGSYSGPNKGNKSYEDEDDVELSETDKDRFEEDEVNRRNRDSLAPEEDEVNGRSRGSLIPKEDETKRTSKGRLVHVEVEAIRRNWVSLRNEEDEVNRRSRGSMRPEEDEANRTCKGSLMHAEGEANRRFWGSGMIEKDEGNQRSRGNWMSEEDEGFESESGQLKAWMGRKERELKNQKKKRSRTCSSVYKNSRKVVELRTEEMQSRPKKH